MSSYVSKVEYDGQRSNSSGELEYRIFNLEEDLLPFINTVIKNAKSLEKKTSQEMNKERLIETENNITIATRKLGYLKTQKETYLKEKIKEYKTEQKESSEEYSNLLKELKEHHKLIAKLVKTSVKPTPRKPSKKQ